MNTLTILFGGRRERQRLSPSRHPASIYAEDSNCPENNVRLGTWSAMAPQAAENEAYIKMLATGIFGLAH